jgi:acyl-CoA synthetase (AMP-forming)/AMP-acid ligase II
MNRATQKGDGEIATQSRAQRTALGRRSKPGTLVELLGERARRQPQTRLYTYLNDGETEAAHLTLGHLEQRARAIGALLQGYTAGGERALLMFPSGLEIIPAFFGCLYGGVIAVPVPLPNLAQPQRALPRLRAIIKDAAPQVVLTTRSVMAKLDNFIAQAPELQAMRWLASDEVAVDEARDWRDPGATGRTLALLQYTSGSTAAPRGVMVSHGNLIENSARIDEAFEITAESVSVTWLPIFHDMGLNNGIIQPLYGGGACVLMAPQAFLQRPGRWLKAVSRYRASISGGPNFAYDLCVRKIPEEQRAELDLSGWTLAYSGAEPVRAETLKRFAAAFAPCGFRANAWYPCYGLAEATLMVTGGVVREGPILCTAGIAALEHNRVVETPENAGNVRTLVGCGHALAETSLAIVDPETSRSCADNEIGEIWVSAPNVAAGYWNRPEETALTFRAHLEPDGAVPYLRTGDLGFLRDGELFVTGRLKDLIIIGGRNLYPNDIELTVEQSHPAVRPGCCVAFAADLADEERLIVVAELERRYQPQEPAQHGDESGKKSNGRHLSGPGPADLGAVTRAIRRAVAEEHDVRVHTVALVRAGTIAKTPSGKVQRRLCEVRFREGTLENLAATE